MLFGNYTGCQISICDESGALIAKTSVVECDSLYGTVTIRGRYPDVKGEALVSVLIFTGSVIHEYSGRIRNSMGDSLSSDITLFQGKEKESRTAKRYQLDNKALILKMVFNTTVLPLLHPIEVSVANMSATGALLKAPKNCFAVGNIVQMELSIGSSDVSMQGKIVRVNTTDTGSAEYGCRFIFKGDKQASNTDSQQFGPSRSVG